MLITIPFSKKQMRIAILVASLACGWPTTEALAHAHLVTAAPGVDTILAGAPTNISLEFDEAVEPRFSGVVVTGTDKVTAKTGPSELKAGHRNVLIAPITDTLKPGKYTVEWHALSADGHKVKGSYAFTIKP